MKSILDAVDGDRGQFSVRDRDVMLPTIMGAGLAGKSNRRIFPMSNTVSFKIPSLPGSINLIYAPRRTIHSDKFLYGLKDEWALWKTQMKVFVPKFKISDDTLIRIDCQYVYNWYYKNKNLRIVDTHNMVKLLIDLIAEKIGFNDCRAKSGSWASVHNATESFVKVTLTEILESEWRAWV